VRRPLCAELPDGERTEIAPGQYRMREELDEITYRLTASPAIAARMHIREIIEARNAGALVIDGRWP
jgi:hypothetical protein